MTGASFAIAASSFNKPSETFIRDHAQTIAPGATILLSDEAPGGALARFPALSGIGFGAARDAPTAIGRGVNTARRFWRRYAFPVLPARDRRKVAAFLTEHAPKALMAEYGPMGVMLAEPAAAAGVPLYVHFHGFDVSVISRMPFWRSRYRALFQRAAGVIGPSRYIVDLLSGLGCPREKLHVCACGIDLARFVVSDRDPFRLVAVGRLVNKKAPHLAIEAFAKIAGEFPQAHLDMIGAGPLYGRCRAIIDRHGLTHRVILHGAQSHDFVAQKMGEASIFLQHSVTSRLGDVEGMPVSVLEAMACGLPVIATRHSGIREAVVDEETGLLVDEHDVSAMADAIRELLSAPGRAARMGEKARARVEACYTQEKSAQTLRSIMGL